MSLSPDKPDVVFFDIDGVLVHECGVAEAGYAYAIHALKTGELDVDPGTFDVESYREEANSVRDIIKGYHPLTKARMLQRVIWEQYQIDHQLDLAELVRLWASFQMRYIARTQPPESYIIPGARRLLEALKPRYTLVTATANSVEQATWLLGYVGLGGLFDAVMGFDLAAEQVENKVQLVAGFLARHAVNLRGSYMVGDGVPDMAAGVANQLRSVGIWSSPAQRERLLQARACRVFQAGGGYGDLAAYLLSTA